jgi:hypothetical protein
MRRQLQDFLSGHNEKGSDTDDKCLGWPLHKRRKGIFDVRIAGNTDDNNLTPERTRYGEKSASATAWFARALFLNGTPR